MELLKNDFARLQQRSLIRWQGKGTEAAGQTIESEGRPARWGNVVKSAIRGEKFTRRK